MEGNLMKKLMCGAVALAFLVSAPASAMSYLTPSNTVAACDIATSVEQAVLADETLANQISGKQVGRTGTTSTVADVTPALCGQIGGAVSSIAATALTNAPVLAPASSSN
jgi:hypothetical protein